MTIINQVPVCDNKKAAQIKENGKIYYVCEQCGRKSFRKIKTHGHIYCKKHYNQIKKYGYCIDDNPRTTMDKNEIIIDGDVAYICIYNQKAELIAKAIIDASDVEKVRYIKWKLSASGYVMNTPKYKGSSVHLSRLILNTSQFVDHINHNPLDNRKSNLRIVTRSQNQMNVNYKGVTTTKSNKYYAYIKINGKMLNLGVYVDEEEAYFARWYAEHLLFKDFKYPKEKPIILETREEEIKKYVEKKVQRL